MHDPSSDVVITCRAFEIGEKLRRALIPEGTVLLEALADDLCEPDRKRAVRGGRRRRTVQNSIDHDAWCRTANGCTPVDISYSTMPYKNRSERASSSSPRTCSGDM